MYLAVLTFDLHNAEAEDYECVERQLAAIGLRKQLQGSNGSQDLPYNTYAGTFNGTDATQVWSALLPSVKAALARCGVHGRLFLTVAANYAWGTASF